MRTGSVRGVLFLLLSLLCTTAAAHNYYVTVCQIDHNVENKALEITFKFFTDDLELALRKDGDDDIRLLRGTSADETDTAVLTYLQKKFKLSVNEQPAELLYVGMEVGLDTTYVYVEAVNMPSLSRIGLRSSILVDLFENHSIIVHARTIGMEKSLLLNKDIESGSIEFHR